MGEDYNFKKAWDEKLSAFKKTWVCKKCHRFCPNCAGRSCVKCCIKKLEAGHLFTEEELTATSKYGQLNPEALFDSKRGAPFNYTVHPKWSSEVKDSLALNPKPLMRPPWPWEQPRYDLNMRLPTTYVSPAEYREEEELEREDGAGGIHNYGVEVPPLSYHLKRYYKTTHPNYILRY